MKRVDLETTRKVAQLARLHLTDEEVATYADQLEKILSHIDQLNEVDVDRVEPLAHPLDLETPMREDRVTGFKLSHDGRSVLPDAAPDSTPDGYRVPSIIE